jgi:hypothetical protein
MKLDYLVRYSYRLVIIGVLFLISSKAIAQNNNQVFSQQFRLGSGIIRIAEQGQLADTVSLWGHTQGSGRFLVPMGTRLSELLSMSGGPINTRANQVEVDWTDFELAIQVTPGRNNPKKPASFRFRYIDPLPKSLQDYVLDNNDVVVVQIKRNRIIIDYIQIISPILSLISTSILLYITIRRL